MSVLGELADRADRAGLFIDFDGTLSEIATTPEAAVAAPGTADLLVRLARRYRLVAVVSGRRVDEVREKLGDPPGVRLFGLYGLEGGEHSETRDDGMRAVEEILPRVLEVAAGIPGALVEPKGANVAVHYRLTPDPDKARVALHDALSSLAGATGMRLMEGKRVVELVPAAAPTKGDVLAREARGLDGILFVGDDLADLHAFAAVDALTAGGAYGLKVAVRSAETPEELLDAADLVVEGPTGLIEMLSQLAD